MLDALAALTKVLLYAGLLSGTGAVFAEMTLHGSPDAVRFLAIVRRRGSLLAIVACLAGTVLLIFRLGGQFDEATLSAVFLSSVGAATCLQLAGAILLLASTGSDSFERSTRLSNAVLAASSFVFSGHAAAAGPIDGLVAFLHVSAAAWWIGSLLLLQHACARMEFEVVVALVRRFSAIATGLIGGLVIAGLVLILVLVDFDREPWLSPYGQTLAIKISIAVLVLGLAGYNKFRLTPPLATGDPAAAAALRRMISVELVLIGAILVTTAILTTYFSPHE
jgi:putative copper export protein